MTTSRHVTGIASSLDKLAARLTSRLIKMSSDGPRDGDVNSDGLVFKNHRWRREDKANTSEIAKKLYASLDMNILGDPTKKTPTPDADPQRKHLSESKDTQIKRWYTNNSDDVREAVTEAEDFIRKYHPEGEDALDVAPW